MKEVCDCGNKTLVPRPLKYDPADKLGPYRRKAKEDEYNERGFL